MFGWTTAIVIAAVQRIYFRKWKISTESINPPLVLSVDNLTVVDENKTAIQGK